jgi:hypothetical protein
MAEKILDIKLNAKEAIAQLKTLDEQIVKLEDNVADAQRELLKMEAELSKLGGSGKELARRTQLNDKIEKTKNLIKQENLALKESKRAKTQLNKENIKLNNKLKEQAKAHNEVSKGLTKSIGGTAILDQATGGLFSKFSGLAQGLRAATGGMKLFKVALIGTGVGALVVALGSLVAYFKSSEEGQNKLTKAMNVAGAVVSNVIELYTKLGEGMFNTWKQVGRFLIGKGSLKEIGEAAGNAFESVSEKVKTLTKDIKEDAKVAMDLSDQLAKADRIDRKLIVDRQKANEKVALLRNKAFDTEKYNNQERIAFLEEAITIEDGITNKEIESARLRFEAKKKENNMTSLARKEDLDEQANLEAKLFELEAKKLNRQREVQNERQMLLTKQKEEEENKRAEEQKKEQDRLDSIQEIRDEYAQKELEKQAQTELQKVELEEATQLKELEDLNASEEAKQQIRDYYLSLKDEARKADYEKEKELKKKEEEDDQKLKDAKLSAQLELAAASQAGIRALGGLFEEGTAASKTAALADIAIGTGIGFINALDIAQKSSKPFGPAAALAFPIFYASQIASVLGAVGQAKKILSTVKGGKGSTPNVSGDKGSAPSIPSFNIVGAAPENQLAEAIGQQDAKPVKAFVVSNEITNAQALERNIIEDASIG